MLKYPGIERFYCLTVIFIGLFQTVDNADSLVTAATCGSDVRTTANKGSDVTTAATNGSDVIVATTATIATPSPQQVSVSHSC